MELRYLRAERGLTKQRNIGLAAVDGLVDIVHFIDDDVELDSSYVVSLMRAFGDNDELAGAGGAVVGAPYRRPGTLARLGLRQSLKLGSVLKSGYNIGCFDSPEPRQVDWLPGCSMSFRLSKIRGLSFDERRTGYALGEDVDFGLKVAQNGRLEHCPEAKLVHHLSNANRLAQSRIARMGVLHRWTLAKDFPNRVSKLAVTYSALSEAAASYYSGVRCLDFARIRCASSVMAGLYSVLLGKEEISS